MTYSPPSVRLVSRDPKISALTNCLNRVALCSSTFDIFGETPKARRFVALFKARNRRTRVLMKRALRFVPYPPELVNR